MFPSHPQQTQSNLPGATGGQRRSSQESQWQVEQGEFARLMEGAEGSADDEPSSIPMISPGVWEKARAFHDTMIDPDPPPMTAAGKAKGFDSLPSPCMGLAGSGRLRK